jgi:Rap1a immunity proteins
MTWPKGRGLWYATSTATKFLDDEESMKSVRAVLNYLKGFGDCSVITEASTKASCPFLLPKENDANQLVRVVDKYIADHPEKLNDPPGIIVWNAFVQAFPNKGFKQPDIKP